MLEVLATYDSKIKAFSAPILFPNIPLGKDYFRQFLASGHANTIHVVEFDLFHLGMYDLQTGKFELHEAPLHLLNMSQLAPEPKKETLLKDTQPLPAKAK